MKATVIFCLALLACQMPLLGQGNSGKWNVSGNQGTQTTDFIGTIDMAPLQFRTHNQERMHIGSDGKVGIGTAQPSEALHIKTGRLRLESLSGSGTRVLAVDSSGNVTETDLALSRTGSSTVNCDYSVIDAWGGSSTGSATELRLCDAWERVRVGAAGAPASALPSLVLDVRGDARTTGNLVVDGLALNGAGAVYVDPNGQLTTTPPAGLPSAAWSTTGNTGQASHFIGTTNAQPLSLRTNNTEAAHFDAAGRLLLHPGTASGTGSRLRIVSDTSDNSTVTLVSHTGADYGYACNVVVDRSLTKALAVHNSSLSLKGSDVFYVWGDGRVEARSVKVHLSGWSDYVFEPGYALRPLAEVEDYISEHGHLPDIPSKAEVLAQPTDLGEMDAQLLAKIEELTLYLIAQEKEMAELRTQIQSLQGNQNPK